MSEVITVHCRKPGLQSLVVAAPRPGEWRAYGVPVGGALDRRSATLANWLVGNPPGAPVLEMCWLGATLHFSAPAQVALTGGRAELLRNGTPVEPYETLDLAAEDELSIGAITAGCRIYLAVGGAWQLPELLDSTSALYVGGSYRNGELTAGTELQIQPGAPIHRRALAPTEWWQPPTGERLLPVYPGPELDWFAPAAVARFFGSAWTVDAASNRMGIRLRSHPLAVPQRELLSSPVVPGTIQVPPGGDPLLLLADAQTTGGYPRIATATEAILDELGQLRPEQSVRFVLR